jgi:hypothetical protein
MQHNYDSLIKSLALNNSIDFRVCKAIVNSPFAYLKYLVTHPSIEEGLRIPYLGAFAQKGEYKNKAMKAENRVKLLLADVTDVSVMMATTLGFVVPSVESTKELLNKALADGDNEKINMIWQGWLEYNK